eukprot:768244-Hanusia_phi.AAC.2
MSFTEWGGVGGLNEMSHIMSEPSKHRKGVGWTVLTSELTGSWQWGQGVGTSPIVIIGCQSSSAQRACLAPRAVRSEDGSGLGSGAAFAELGLSIAVSFCSSLLSLLRQFESFRTSLLLSPNYLPLI